MMMPAGRSAINACNTPPSSGWADASRRPPGCTRRIPAARSVLMTGMIAPLYHDQIVPLRRETETHVVHDLAHEIQAEAADLELLDLRAQFGIRDVARIERLPVIVDVNQ